MEIEGFLGVVHHAISCEFCSFGVGGFDVVGASITQDVLSTTGDLRGIFLLGRTLDSFLRDLLLSAMEVLAAISGRGALHCVPGDKLDVLCLVPSPCCVLLAVLGASGQVYFRADDVFWCLWCAVAGVYGDELGGV